MRKYRKSLHDSKNSIMATKGKRPMRALTASDKIEAIQRVNDGESKASVARDIGVPESTLRGWCKNEDKLRYMSSRQSTPDTDKSLDSLSDGRPMEKRAKYDILATCPNVVVLPIAKADSDRSALSPSGLDLSNADKNSDLTQKLIDTGGPDPDMSKTKADLSRFNTELLNSLITNNKTKPDLATAMSMSTISPLNNLNHMSGLSGMTHGNLGGLSINDIATNLNLIAQLNPSLNALTNSLNSGAKALRSIRSSKPSSSHNTPSNSLASNDKFKSYKMPSYEYDKSWTSKAPYNSKEPPVDDVFWYWLKTQQAMIDLSARGGHTVPNLTQHGSTKEMPISSASAKASSAKPLTTIPPSDALNKDSWFWQYYKQFGVDLTHGKTKTDSLTIPVKTDIIDAQKQDILPEKVDESQAEKQDDINTICKDESLDKGDEIPSQSKARNVLDNLLSNNNNYTFPAEKTTDDAERDNSENEFDCEVSEALEHGEKFLKWLEACQDPSVTRMQVYQLKGLLDNIRARAVRKPPNQTTHVKDRVSRRKWYNIMHYLPNYDSDKDNITGNVNF